MGDEQHGGLVALAQLSQQVVHPEPGEGVERPERLVGQQQLRLAHQRAGQGDPLLLAAGQLLGQARSRPGEPDLGERCAARARARRAIDSEHDVVEHACPWQQPRVLKHHRRCSGTASVPSPAPWSRPATARSNVLLPEPLRPSSATNSPARDVRSIPWSTAPARRSCGQAPPDPDRDAGPVLQGAPPCERPPFDLLDRASEQPERAVDDQPDDDHLGLPIVGPASSCSRSRLWR